MERAAESYPYATATSDAQFNNQYSMHDIAEERVESHMDSMGLRYNHTGFDPHDEGGVRIIGSRQDEWEPDFLVEGAVRMDVKTKKKNKHIGNVPKRKWDDYGDDVWFVWFHVHEMRVIDCWSYKKEHAEVARVEDSPYGEEQWVVVDRGSLGPVTDFLFECARVREMLG